MDDNRDYPFLAFERARKARRSRQYGLFERHEVNGRCKWVRVYSAAYPLRVARVVFQSALLVPAIIGGPPRELRPVRGWRPPVLPSTYR